MNVLFLARINTSDISASMPLDEVLDAGSTRRALTAFVCKTLKRGLSDRVKAVAVMIPPPEVLPINDQLVDTRLPWMHVGLVLDLECAYRLVDHGPAAAQNAEQEVEAFKNFWGSKSELRRFKDGRITESVVWEAPSTDDRLQIPTMIVQHLLQTHLGISSASVTSWQPSFDSLIRLPSPVAAFYTRNGIQGGFRPALLAFQEMVRSIKSLDDKFPLGILNISPASSILRSTSVFAPVPISVAASKSTPVHAKHLPVMDITIQFEKAGQWPDDLQAIQKVKLAFLEQLATALESKEPGMKAEIVLDRSALATADHAALQIITPAGWAFSAHIHHDREALLLDRIIDDRSHITRRKLSQPTDPAQVRARRHALRALDIHHCRFAHAPAHHRAVSHLTSQYPAYPGTVRLVKRWFASHWLLRGHVSEEAVELVTCMVFLNTGSTRNAPNTRERGFAAVMSLLREWKWEEGMTIPIYELDEQQSSPSSSVQPLTRSLASATAAWRLVTTINPDGRMWTAQGPDAVVARRIQTLARATCEVLSEMHHGCVDVKVSTL
jgi:U3 small nucleolar RNA-associated protein 22